MKYISLIFLLLTSFCSFGQKTPSSEQVKAFFESKTYIVYEGSLFSSYNIYLKDAIDKEWTITPFSTIPYSLFEAKRKEAKSSFLVVSDVQFTGDKTGTTYNFLNLVLGGNYRSLTEMPDLVNIPLSISDQDEENYVYKLVALIRFIQKHMLLLQSQPGLCNKEFEGIYKQKTTDFSDKTIYMVKEELNDDVNSLPEIAEVYPYPVVLSTLDEIEAAIASRNSNGLILHIVGPDSPKGNRSCFKVLIGTDDAEVYYYDQHKVSAKNPTCFLKKDFENIAKEK
ncbi:MAG: hypothetical protein K9H64_06600 [Bacteroidales bacterium]|nr:hypothetical protein [Bacteroidales bacterium]MCF8455406.1 hypothetical protein [Bacteroidales bacterium]